MILVRKDYVAVDIGATNIRVALGSPKDIYKTLSKRTNKDHGPSGVSSQIIRMIKSLEADNIYGIGVGSIGPLDLHNGRILNTPNLPFNEISVVKPLMSEFDVPVRMLNDCTVAVLGEQLFGAGKDLRNLVYITLSTGLGGGAIVDDHLLIGKDGNAAEVGHITIDPNSTLICGCCGRGHWEAFSSGNNIPKLIRLRIKDGQSCHRIIELAGGDPEKIAAENLFQAAKEGDPDALKMVYELGKINAIGFANVVNIFDPQLITIGGSIALNNPELVVDPIMDNIDKHLINRRPKIMITPLGEDVVLYGALALAINSLDANNYLCNNEKKN